MSNCTIDAGRTMLVLRISMNELNYKPLGYRSQFYGEVLGSFSHKLHHSCRVRLKVLAGIKQFGLL